MHAIDNNFLIGISRQFQIDTIHRPMARRDDNAKPFGDPSDCPPLQQQRGDHDNEGRVEQQLSFGHAFNHRHDGQQD